MSACPTKKIRHSSEQKAKAALTGARAAAVLRSGPGRKEQRVYACHLCRGWHLTSQPEGIPKP